MGLTAVQVCNLALAKIGSPAMVTSISPTDGSTESQYCALFFSQCFGILLGKHAWSFATNTVLGSVSGNYVSGGASGAFSLVLDNVVGVGVGMAVSGSGVQAGTVVSAVNLASGLVTLSLALVGQAAGAYALTYLLPYCGNPAWAYAYSLPADFDRLVECRDASVVGVPVGYPSVSFPGLGLQVGMDSVVEYAIEGGTLFSNDGGLAIVYLSNALELIGSASVLFCEALAALLASYLAGPLIRNDVGVAASEKLLQLFEVAWRAAVEADGQFRRVSLNRYVPSGIRARF